MATCRRFVKGVSSLGLCPRHVTHCRGGLRVFVAGACAPSVALSRGEDSFLPWRFFSLVGLFASAPAVSVAILPPSFSHRSSIFLFRRFLADGSGIVVSSLVRRLSNAPAPFLGEEKVASVDNYLDTVRLFGSNRPAPNKRFYTC